MLISFFLSELVIVVKGLMIGKDVIINQISTDTRKKNIFNSLFIALKGKNFDGHDFIYQALKNGAIALLSNKIIKNNIVSQIIVNDTQIALGKIGQFIRYKSNALVLSLTGSTGKTTVKEMTAKILANCGKTTYTKNNFNNKIGVPLTLINLTKYDKYVLIEIGANSPGEISYLSKLVKPKYALINNVCFAHLSGFKNLYGVAKSKGEIFDGLLFNGIAILNFNSNYLYIWEKKIKNKKIFYFSKNYFSESSLWASDIFFSDKKIYFNLNTKLKKIKICLNLLGTHNIYNALAAASLSLAAGINLNNIQNGLNSMKPIYGRLFPIQINKKQTIIDDSYNSNYSSMISAIDVLKKMPGYLVLVVSDMLELGKYSLILHKKIGEIAYKKGINKIISYGFFSKKISIINSIGEHFRNKDMLIRKLLSLLHQYHEITILLKGSHKTNMHKIVQILKEKTIC